jgi:hypothetical protein
MNIRNDETLRVTLGELCKYRFKEKLIIINKKKENGRQQKYPEMVIKRKQIWSATSSLVLSKRLS